MFYIEYMVVGAGGRVTSPVGVWLSALDALLERLSHSGVDLALIKAICTLSPSSSPSLLLSSPSPSSLSWVHLLR